MLAKTLRQYFGGKRKELGRKKKTFKHSISKNNSLRLIGVKCNPSIINRMEQYKPRKIKLMKKITASI